jgi:hypothetical protein
MANKSPSRRKRGKDRDPACVDGPQKLEDDDNEEEIDENFPRADSSGKRSL